MQNPKVGSNIKSGIRVELTEKGLRAIEYYPIQIFKESL